jgi:hypothetical protein
MGTTSPDNIAFPDTSTPWSSVPDFSVLSSSVQTALDKRQIYNFQWVDQAARNAQLGMRQGDTGYQIDTKSEYLYEGGAWRLALPYAEFLSPTRTVALTTYVAFAGILIQSGTSTSTTFATASVNVITVPDPGIYLISVFSNCSVSVSGAFIMVGMAANATTNLGSQVARGQFGGDNVAMTTAVYRQASTNGIFNFWYNQPDTVSRSYQATIRVMRLA